MNKFKRIAILLMAGSSNRFCIDKNIKKQFLEIKGKPIFLYSLRSLVSSSLFGKIIIVCAKGEENMVSELLRNECYTNLISIISGGQSRNESVLLALNYIEKEYSEQINQDTFVFVHDAARPCLPISVLNELNSLCGSFDAIVPAISLTDSIMKNDVYVSRDSIIRIQTPQAFRYFKLLSIYKSGFEDASTDDFSKAINAGLSHKVITGSPLLYKITFPEEIEFFEKIL